MAETNDTPKTKLEESKEILTTYLISRDHKCLELVLATIDLSYSEGYLKATEEIGEAMGFIDAT